MFEVAFSSSSTKFIKKAEKQTATRIMKEIENLRSEPFPRNVKRVVNREEKVFRVRVGDYRIQYSVFYEKNLIFISDVDKRSKAYD